MRNSSSPSCPWDSSGAPRQLLRKLFDSAVAAVHPETCLAAALPVADRGESLVIGSGKAGAAMARVVEQHFDGRISGAVVVPDGHEADCRRVRVLVAAHPVPDARSVTAARTILDLARGAGSGRRIICLLSGGGSSLLCLPAPGITLEDKRAVNRDLLRAGASIGEINCVRKHLSAIKGGRLALACAPASCSTFAISDVTGDDPALIASGPTVGNASRPADALAVLKKYSLLHHEAAVRCLGASGNESPRPDDPRLARNEITIVANGRRALTAAAAAAQRAGVSCRLLDPDANADAADLAAAHAAAVNAILAGESKPGVPLLLLSGGETTVKVTGPGRGGRNTHYLLALAAALDGAPGVFVLAGDTDGIDGCCGAAGAFYEPAMALRWRELGLDPQDMLASNNSGEFFAALEALFVTGPTRTNVNDFRAILIMPVAWDPR